MGNKRDSLLYNADGYYDPTAGESLKAIMSNSPSGFVRWRGQPVYICTPEVPTTEEQCTHLERFCRFVARQGAHPISPFLFYSEILDLTDSGHVRSVLRWTRGWLRRASEIWILGNSVPWNLRTEVNRAMSKGKAVRFDRVLFPLEHAQEQPEKQFPPVYRHTGSFARQAGEIEAYRNSMKENCACRDAIDQTIRENFDGLRLNTGIERKILDTFGPERVTWVLANTIMQREHDGRFSLNNRAWAQAVQIPIDRTEGGIVRNDHFVLSSHSAVLDGFVNAARREMAADLEKGKYLKEQNARPSVRAALQDKQQTAKNADKKPEQSSKKSRQVEIE